MNEFNITIIDKPTSIEQRDYRASNYLELLKQIPNDKALSIDNLDINYSYKLSHVLYTLALRKGMKISISRAQDKVNPNTYTLLVWRKE